MKILIIEDEPGLRENMNAYLKEDGNICNISDSLESAIEKLTFNDYDCVLLDIGLPDGDGFEILDFIKAKSKSEAVLIISARNSLDDKIKGFNIGADDYLTKPFHLAELKARLVAIYRRKNQRTSNVIVCNEISINLLSRSVEVNNKPLVLTRKEYELLLYFVANEGKVISKTAIATHLWGDEMDMYNNFDFIYTHIKNLRKKIQEASSGDYLKSIYGIGYKFSAP